MSGRQASHTKETANCSQLLPVISTSRASPFSFRYVLSCGCMECSTQANGIAESLLNDTECCSNGERKRQNLSVKKITSRDSP